MNSGSATGFPSTESFESIMYVQFPHSEATINNLLPCDNKPDCHYLFSTALDKWVITRLKRISQQVSNFIRSSLLRTVRGGGELSQRQGGRRRLYFYENGDIIVISYKQLINELINIEIN